jgi:ornithine cyclodeaminase
LYVLNQLEIKKLLKNIDLEKVIEQGFISYSNKLAVIPPVGELLFSEPPGEVHIKYGYIINEKYYVIKIASGFPNNIDFKLSNGQGMMLLFDQKTGKPISILLDNGYLTDVRTAIAGRICARQFSNKITGIGVIGTGTQAKIQLEYLSSITDCKKVILWGRSVKKAKNYKKIMLEYGFDVNISSSIDFLSKNCNLIILATSSKKPLLLKEHLRPGMNIVAVGSDTELKRELGEGILSFADLIITDSLSQCRLRGEISHSLKNNEIEIGDVRELGKVLDNTIEGRTKKNQIIVSDLTGVAVQDIKIASKVFEVFLENEYEV